jgi:hypothetical protein
MEIIEFLKRASNFTVWDREQIATSWRRITAVRWNRLRGGRAAADQITVSWILDFRYTRFHCPTGLNFTMCVLHTGLTPKLDVSRVFHSVNHCLKLRDPVIVYRSVCLRIMKDLVLVMFVQMGTFNRLIQPASAAALHPTPNRFRTSWRCSSRCVI